MANPVILAFSVAAEDALAPPRKTLEKLRDETIANLERRGYDIRGKTPAQIRQILRRRSKSVKALIRAVSALNLFFTKLLTYFRARELAPFVRIELMRIKIFT